MADILIAALSSRAHIAPLLTVAADQVERGNAVTVLTGIAQPHEVHAIGARPAEPAEVRNRNQFDAIIADDGFMGLPLPRGGPALLYYTPTLDSALRSPGGALADRLIVPSVPPFEYPRRDLPANVRFVGAVHARPSGDFTTPPWWAELDAPRPVVHVTGSTRLIESTLDALDDVTVVVTGGTPARSRVPANAFVADHIRPEMLLPKVDVMVTDAGYGAIQRAVASGVPLVVASSAERGTWVAWAGVGVDLGACTPPASAIADAVHQILRDERYLRRAREVEVAFAQRDGVAEIAAIIDEVTRPRKRRHACVPLWNTGMTSDSTCET